MLGETKIVPVADVVVGRRKRPLDEARVTGLSGSIATVGLLQPIVVTDTLGLVAGYHRLEAARRLGWATIPARIAPLDALRAELAEIDENLIRQELTALEEAEHLQRRVEILEALGERAQASPGTNQYTTREVVGDTVSPTKTTADIAAEMGLGERSAQRRIQIARDIAADVKEAIAATPLADRTRDLLDLARLEPEAQRRVVEIEGVKEGTTSVLQARREVTRREKREAPPLPSDKYRVVYADPPWSYGNSGVIGNDNYGHVQRHYPSMTIEELCAMGTAVRAMVEDDAVLFLWVTSPLLEECFPVIHAWGFRYKTSFIWDKVRHNFGHYNSVRHELLLVCTRGSCTPDNPTLYDSVQTIERSEVHSQKPEAFRGIIDALYTRGRRIELFARTAAEGWEAWGNDC